MSREGRLSYDRHDGTKAFHLPLSSTINWRNCPLYLSSSLDVTCIMFLSDLKSRESVSGLPVVCGDTNALINIVYTDRNSAAARWRLWGASNFGSVVARLEIANASPRTTG